MREQSDSSFSIGEPETKPSDTIVLSPEQRERMRKLFLDSDDDDDEKEKGEGEGEGEKEEEVKVEKEQRKEQQIKQEPSVETISGSLEVIDIESNLYYI